MAWRRSSPSRRPGLFKSGYIFEDRIGVTIDLDDRIDLAENALSVDQKCCPDDTHKLAPIALA